MSFVGCARFVADTYNECLQGTARDVSYEGDLKVVVPITPVRVGDVVRLKKPHPCGANEWQVTKLGMDIGLTCLGCDRKVRLVRAEFDRRFRGFVRRADDEQDR